MSRCVSRQQGLEGEATSMAASDSFTDVMARLRAGDEAAAREVFQRFVGKLIRLARRRFDATLRHKVDPEDVVQSAYKSFFVRYGEGKLTVQDWGNLWGRRCGAIWPQPGRADS